MLRQDQSRPHTARRSGIGISHWERAQNTKPALCLSTEGEEMKKRTPNEVEFARNTGAGIPLELKELLFNAASRPLIHDYDHSLDADVGVLRR